MSPTYPRVILSIKFSFLFFLNSSPTNYSFIRLIFWDSLHYYIYKGAGVICPCSTRFWDSLHYYIYKGSGVICPCSTRIWFPTNGWNTSEFKSSLYSGVTLNTGFQYFLFPSITDHHLQKLVSALLYFTLELYFTYLIA